MSAGDKKKIVAIMKKTCMHAYLATCEGKKPKVRPVSPIVDNDMSIWISCFASSRKVSQIKERIIRYVLLSSNNRQVINQQP